MVGWLRTAEGAQLRARPAVVRPHGLPLLAVPLPADPTPRQLRRAVRALRRRGIRRCLAPVGFPHWRELREGGLAPVDTLPLCRALGAALALCLLEGVPPRRRRVALRGTDGLAAWPLAETLCPHVGALLLDLDRGQEELGDALRKRYGAAPMPLGPVPPQVSLELAPRSRKLGITLRLWGEPDLGGLVLHGKYPPPAGVEELPFLALLWETGRVKTEEILVVNALDREAETPYNTLYCK